MLGTVLLMGKVGGVPFKSEGVQLNDEFAVKGLGSSLPKVSERCSING